MSSDSLWAAKAVARALLRCVIRFYSAGTNGRSVLGLICNFLINFSPVLLWLAIFKNARRIPTSWRPPIHATLMRDLDASLYSWSLNGVLFCLLFVFLGLLWYAVVRLAAGSESAADVAYDVETGGSVDEDSKLPDLAEFPGEFTDSEDPVVIQLTPDKYEYPSPDSSTDLLADFNSDDELLGSSCATSITSATVSPKPVVPTPRRTVYTHLAIPTILICTCWFILNLGYALSHSVSPVKDVLAWTHYVVLHVAAPIVMAVYLYAFKAPGAVATFSYALGLQNVLGVLTHLAFPNAPPWFHHVYPAGTQPTYAMPGYAAGLIRIDHAWGSNLMSDGFKMSPIVFGAFPSLHSAMAVQTLLFSCFFGSFAVAIPATMFTVTQWWATMYLDHHFRIDLSAGLLYALVSFTVFLPRLVRVRQRYVEGVLAKDWSRATMGERVFRGTLLEKWFSDQ